MCAAAAARHLHVEPLWHCKVTRRAPNAEQAESAHRVVHASCVSARQPQAFSSGVTALEFSADGTGLYAGCDATSPKRDPEAADEVPVKLLAVQVCRRVVRTASKRRLHR